MDLVMKNGQHCGVADVLPKRRARGLMWRGSWGTAQRVQDGYIEFKPPYVREREEKKSK